MAETDHHLRVAFLPFGPITLKSLRPESYSANPQTLGEHLRKCRLERGLIQKEVASLLGVNPWTYLGWEHDRKNPTVRMLPRIINFLGYDPVATEARVAGALKMNRRSLGLSQAAMACRLNIDEGTLRRYESGEWKPRGRRLLLIQWLIQTQSKG